MTKPAHTSGPWEERWIRPDKSKGHDFDPVCSVLATMDGRKIRIADIPDPLTPEEEANARLIAAAPEMLDALELCEDVLSDLARSDDGTPSVSALVLARSALAKVKGDAP